MARKIKKKSYQIDYTFINESERMAWNHIPSEINAYDLMTRGIDRNFCESSVIADY